MTIYILCYNEDIGCTSDNYVTEKEDIPQLAIDYYWGTLIKPEPGRLTVVVTWDTVIVTDNHLETSIEYNIITFDKRES